MKKLFVTLILTSFLFVCYSSAQVRGISYTFSPTVEYTVWDDQAGLDDGLLLGGKIGIGFGEFFEFRGSYFQDLDIERNFEDYGFENFDNVTFEDSEIDIIRYGGEIKANFSKGKLLPYVTLGTGIQEIKFNDFEEDQQIYLSAGLGLTVGIADRFILTLEGKNTRYRYDAFNNLTSFAERTALVGNNNVFTNESLSNWSALASFQLYLGGRKPGEMSELDRAYFDSFNGGGSGFNLGIEGVVGKMNFNENLPFRDTWMAGASAGFDIGPYIGLRGFYWQALEEGELLNTDPLAMYGGEVRMKLNTAGGFVPFIMIGGGRIDVDDDYEGEISTDTGTFGVNLTDDDDTGFAMGGAGVTIPLTSNFKVFGSVRSILTSSADIEEINAPEEIRASYFWSAGFNLRFGKKRRNPNQLLNERISSEVEAQQIRNDLKADSLSGVYQARVLQLEDQLLEAYATNDLQKAEMIKIQQQEAEQIVQEIEKRNDPVESKPSTAAAVNTAPQSSTNTAFPGINIVPTNSVISMSPAEFENLIEEILESSEPQMYNYMMGAPNNFGPTQFDPASRSQSNNLEARLQRIENLILGANQNNDAQPELLQTPVESKDSTMAPVVEMSSTEKDMLKMLYLLEEKLDNNNAELAKMNMRLETVESKKSKKKLDKKMNDAQEMQEDIEEEVEKVKKKKKRKGLFGKKNDN
jgi:hypothetical protein